MTASATARNRGFCRSTPAKRWLPLMVGKLNLSIDKTEVGALDHGQEPDHHLLQTFPHSGKLFQAFTATQLLDIVDDDLDAQYPLAPQQKSSTGLTHQVVSTQYNAIYAVIAASQ